MSRQLSELETVLAQLVTEHQTLLKQLTLQQAAMQAFNLDAIEQGTKQQDETRKRIATLELRRRSLTDQIAKLLRVPGKLTLVKLAELHPPRRNELLKLRAQLRQAISETEVRATVAGKLSAAVLGHLNTVVRLLASAVEKAGVYTKNGAPKMSQRIGMMEAVG
jgi:hypothetical protein